MLTVNLLLPLCLPILHILESLVMSCNLCYGCTAITSYRDGHFGDSWDNVWATTIRRLSDKNESFSLEQPWPVSFTIISSH